MFRIFVLAFALMATPALAQETDKLLDISKNGTNAPSLKNMDSDLKDLAAKFQKMLNEQGFGNDKACQTVCTASCTWVNGQCQATTSCSLQCGF